MSVRSHTHPAPLPEATESLGLRQGRAPLSAIVRVLDAPANPASFRLAVGNCVLGSAPGCDVVIAAPTVSRTHVELGLIPEGVSVRDLGSRNGTFYDEQRIERMVLGLGRRIRVGGVTVAVDADTEALRAAPPFEGASYHGLIGVSPASRSLFAALAKLEGSLATVLIEGETGVGKERVATAVHQGSRIASGPFVTINCGALPRDLIYSELFGHRRGAFSGAFDARKGAFESADGGTLFLDEIGELPLELQPALLRAIDLGEVRPLGDDQARRVRVRVIAATNRDLETESREGRFREDLFYRLAVVRLRVPPLRERPEDIEPIARQFARSADLMDLAPDVLRELSERPWLGNARELKNAILSYAALGALPQTSAPRVTELEAIVDKLVDPQRPYLDQKDSLVDAFTRAYLKALLQTSGGNQSLAARLAGLNRTYLLRLLAKHGMGRGGEGGGGDE